MDAAELLAALSSTTPFTVIIFTSKSNAPVGGDMEGKLIFTVAELRILPVQEKF